MSSSPVTVFHFTQPTKERIIEYSRRISLYGAIICFDFEDILMDLSTHSYSEDERDGLRSAIAETLNLIFRQKSSPRAGVRLNSVSSIHFEDDLRILKFLDPAVFLDSVFLPKSETPEEICSAIETLHAHNIPFREIIPVIETKRGMENIKSLLSLTNKEFSKIAFGHCDFNRDNNYFPFFHHDTEEYWQWIRQILFYAGRYNKMFINSPYLHLQDISGFSKMLLKLKGMTPNEIGQITLAERQTRLCAELQDSKVPAGDFTPLHIKNSLKKAVEIMVDFEINKVQDKSFSVNSAGVLISPHEYAAALEYLEIHAGKYEIEK